MISRILSLVGGFNPTVLMAALLAAMMAIGAAYFYGRSDGKDIAAVESYKAIQEKQNAASRADDVARRCSSDPSCRMRNDGYSRD